MINKTSELQNASLNIFYIIEPVPDWKKAYKVWGWVWYFYVYGFSALFVVICSLSSFVLLHLLIQYGCRQRIVGVLTLICLSILGIFNSLHLFFDPHSRSIASFPMIHHLLKCLTSPLIVTIYFLYSKFLVRLTKYELNRYGRFYSDPKKDVHFWGCSKLTIVQLCLLFTFYSSVLALNWLDVHSENKNHRYWHACTKGVFITWCLIASFSIFHESCVLAHYAEKSRKILSILQRRRSKCPAQLLHAPISSNSDLSFLKTQNRILSNGFADKRPKAIKRHKQLKTYRNKTFKSQKENSSIEENSSESENKSLAGEKLDETETKTQNVMDDVLPNEAENTFYSDTAGLLTATSDNKNEYPLISRPKEETWLQMSTMSVRKMKREGKKFVDQLKLMKSNLSEHRESRRPKKNKKYLLKVVDQSSTESDHLSEQSPCIDMRDGMFDNADNRSLDLVSRSISVNDILSGGARSNDYDDDEYFDNFSAGYSADDDESRKTALVQTSKTRQNRIASLPCCVVNENKLLLSKFHSLSSDHLPRLDLPERKLSDTSYPKFSQRISLANLRMSRTYKKISWGSYFVAMVGFCTSFANIYGLFGVFGVFSNVPEADAWPWLAFQAILKCLDVALALSLTWIVHIASEKKFKISRRRTKS